MSLPKFQEALALLIRQPESHRGTDTETFLSSFDLSTAERTQLLALARDPKVVKYGHSMLGVRWENIQHQLRICHRYLSPEALEELSRRYFEPQAVRLKMGAMTAAFLDFLSTDPDARQLIDREAPPFFSALVRFERAQFAFRPGRRWPEVSAHSLLRHSAFQIVELDYDVPGFLNALSRAQDDEANELAPVKRSVVYLLLGTAGQPECRFFEIDRKVQVFLLGQLETPPQETVLPESYADLVGLGLCKPIN